MKIAEIFNLYKKCKGVSIDSRTIRAGEMFFALSGPNFDGHAYIEKAYDSGAKYAVIDNNEYSVLPNTILVNDVEATLQGLAKFYRSHLTIPFIGLTGSNGKTTTKELISSILSEKYRVYATKGNLNNHLGVPLSVLSIKEHHELAIIEMGANHAKEIEFLSEICMPDYGLITNIGKAHLEGFGSIEGVRKAKTELFEYIRKVKGTIFFNSNDTYLQSSILKDDKIIEYNIDNINILSTFPTVSIEYEGIKYTTKLSGGYNATNMLAAITIGRHFQLSDQSIVKGLDKYSPDNNRSEIKKTEKNTLILDAYNANPTSMKASIENLHKADAKNKVLIIGHMLELGETSTSEHTELINLISTMNFSKVYLVGTEFNNIEKPKHFFYSPTTNNLIEDIKKTEIRYSTILLKGSRGVALELIIPYL
jgi:UDP-N-acetylmuramoyl-tripeptide--D-alanyl-D-alanine ligase